MGSKYNLSIARQKFFKNRREITDKIFHSEFVEVIEKHNDLFVWLEDTEKGKKTLSNLDKFRESFRAGIIKGHHKIQACCDFDLKKGWHKLLLDYIELYGTISITGMPKINKYHLKILLDIANSLGALLLNNGTEVINESNLDE